MLSFRSATRAVALVSLGLPYVFGYYGVCYDSNRRSSDQIRQDFQAMKNNFPHVRVYTPGTPDLPYAKLAQEVGVNVLIGISGDNGDDELRLLCNSVKAYPSNVDAISVGNENLNHKDAGSIIELINQVKGCVQGLNIPVISVQQNGQWLNSQGAAALAQAVDKIGVNIYTFFNRQGPTDVSSFLYQLNEMKNRFPNRDVWVAETGYPSCGTNSEGKLSSVDQLAAYFSDVFSAIPGYPIYYFMYNDAEKPGPEYEHCFGMNRADGTTKFQYGTNNPGNTTPAVTPQPAPAPAGPVVPAPAGPTGADSPAGPGPVTPTSGDPSQYPPKAC